MDINRYMVKAKTIKTGEWVIGYYYKIAETTHCPIGDCSPVPVHHYILHETMTDWELPNQMLQYEIDSDTICKYVGFEDKNKKMIWENDIIHCTTIDCEEYAWQIVWDKEELGFKATNGKENYGTEFEYLPCLEDIKIVGNIFDNPELLRGRIA